MKLLKQRYLVALAGLSALGFAFTTSAAVVDFSSATDLNSFDYRTSGTVTSGSAPAVTSNGLQFSATAGRSGGGGVTHISGNPTDVQANYTPESYNLTNGDTFTVSGFFQALATPPAASATGNVFQVGLSASSSLGYYANAGNAYIAARISDANNTDTKYNLQTQLKTTSASSATTVTVSASDFSLTSNEWYRLIVSFTRSATPGNFDYSVAFEDWGADGAAFVSTVSSPAAGTLSNADLYSDTTLFAGFRSIENSLQAMDTFTTSIPEPSSLLALAGGALLALRTRRRR